MSNAHDRFMLLENKGFCEAFISLSLTKAINELAINQYHENKLLLNEKISQDKIIYAHVP